MKNKLWREAGLRGFEIVFVIALLGLIFGIESRAFESEERVGLCVITVSVVVATATACLAGWLGKRKFPEWEAPTILGVKFCGALVGFAAFWGFVIIQVRTHPNAFQEKPECINNLRLIDSAKQQWALEQRKEDTDTPQGSDLQPYLGRGAKGELPICPMDTNNPPSFDTSYSANSVATHPTCKIQPKLHILP
jgi:hypothetical protein